MSRDEATRMLAEADPIADYSAGVEAVTGGDQLLESILSTPNEAVAHPAPSQRRARVLRAGFAVAAVCGVVLAIILLGSGSDHPNNTAYGSELVEFAEASPQVLLDLPGWRVADADEESSRNGRITFVNWPMEGPRPRPRISVEMEWSRHSISHLKRRYRRTHHLVESGVPALGTTTDVYTSGRTRTRRVLTSVVSFEGRSLEIWTVVPDLATYEKILEGFRKVDVDTWLDAMPPSVINRFERPDAVMKMLKGIPLPPGFDTSSIPGSQLTRSHYNLVANVSGTIACTWFQRWFQAMRDGDKAAEEQAFAAMQTSRRWPALTGMARTSPSGGYATAVWQYADSMKHGTEYFGRPLDREIDNGLGCPSFGVQVAQ